MKIFNKEEIKGWIKTIVFAFLISQLISQGIIVNATIPSASMESTIMTGDRLVANRLAYVFEEPERGDIITFVFREKNDDLYIKRLIALPGESVEIINGIVYIDGEELSENYLSSDLDFRDFGPVDVPEGCYFFLGDNRVNSADARVWDNPFIPEEDLVGKAVFKYYPKIELLLFSEE